MIDGEHSFGCRARAVQTYPLRGDPRTLGRGPKEPPSPQWAVWSTAAAVRHHTALATSARSAAAIGGDPRTPGRGPENLLLSDGRCGPLMSQAGTEPPLPFAAAYGQCGPQSSGWAPHCPYRPLPHWLGAKGLDEPGRLVCWGGGGAEVHGCLSPPPMGVCFHGTGNKRPMGDNTKGARSNTGQRPSPS